MKITNISQAGDAYHIYKNRKSLLAMLRDVKNGQHRLSFFTYIVSLLVFVYTFWPADVLPDFIPFIGWVDDGILLFLVFKQLKKELNQYNEKLASKSQWQMIKK